MNVTTGKIDQPYPIAEGAITEAELSDGRLKNALLANFHIKIFRKNFIVMDLHRRVSTNYANIKQFQYDADHC